MTRRRVRSPPVSVYDRMCWPPGELERALSRGTHRRELAAYLGYSEYALLRSLARAGERVRRRTRDLKVYLLPGIMGSQLGYRRVRGLPPDLLWVDPGDIARGRLLELRCGADRNLPHRLTPLGGIEYSYLPLKLRLQAAGFEVTLYDYDWREDLGAQGAKLAARLRADRSVQLALIGHSMGGLLGRAALAHCAGSALDARITRIIGLGTPHGGSLAAVQALRATYPVVFRLAAIDRKHDAATLSRRVFSSFRSLYQLLPAETGRLDLLDPSAWPRGAGPRRSQLAAVRDFNSQLARADDRFASIIGTGQRTVTGIERRGDQFHYQVSAAGDGTVAVLRATLPGASNHYLRCEHSELPRSELVADAVIDLLRTGRTRRLPQRVIIRKGRPTYVSDAELRGSLDRKIDWQSLRTAERRRYLQRLNSPPPLYWPR